MSEAGDPLPDREVQVLLPAAYGLSGLEAVLGQPDDFGQEDRRFSATTDAGGEFFCDLGDRLFHVSFWLIPPLGARPRQPPPPFLLLRLPSAPPGEYYAVQTWDGEFKVFTADGRKLQPSESRLSCLTARAESSSSNGRQSTVAVVELRLRRE